MTSPRTLDEVGAEEWVESLPPACSYFGADWRFRRGAVAFHIQRIMTQDGRPDITVENHQPVLPAEIRRRVMTVSTIDPESEIKAK